MTNHSKNNQSHFLNLSLGTLLLKSKQMLFNSVRLKSSSRKILQPEMKDSVNEISPTITSASGDGRLGRTRRDELCLSRKGQADRQDLRTRVSAFPAFTIVELLVVIIVIAVLAAITIVSYIGITANATKASLQADLSNNAKILAMYNTDYGYYPTTLDSNNCPTAPTSDSKYCLKTSNGNKLTYEPSSTTNATDYYLYDTKGTYNYRTSSTGGVTATSISKVCPYGFIVVPGSSTYGTSDFCVMKYEAKADANGDGIGDTTYNTGYNTWPAGSHAISSSVKLVSTAQGYPVANISQTTAISAASSYTNNCSGSCHLITEAEWMTIVQNVLKQSSNWSGGAVGSGYIYSGHNDNSPSNALEASGDNNGYANTGNTSGNQRRTLTLSNGEVIWDLAGDVWEWTQGTIASGAQPGLSGESAFTWKEWNNSSLLQNGLPTSSMPSSTNISGITWSSASGVGQLYSDYTAAYQAGFLRGGGWDNGSHAGVLSLTLNGGPGGWWCTLGLRVSQG